MGPQRIIAHYRITSKLGEGGMGEVWRATDTKLGRDVALKILTEAFADDVDRMARFEREAQVLASLNHPNIAAIYGVEDRAIVMELVEGPTLADRITEGPIAFDEAIAIARQMCDALEAAHEKFVVHRDLKPANVKVTPQGRVKVLDFGLAKAMTEEVSTGKPSISPTLTMRATVAGIILGTAAYMSPEQARGKAVDKRADIWSFGVMLYEMLTGRTLFHRETVSDTLAAVLTKEPEWDRVPAKARRLLRKCLEKDPKLRLRDIGDAWELLEDGSATVGKSSKLPLVVAGIAVMIAAGLGLALWRAPRPGTSPLLSLNVDLGPDAVAGRDFTVAISPDGTRIAFPVRTARGGRALAARLLGESGYVVLSGTDGAENPFFSPDGQWVGFASDRKLKKVSVQGGAPIALCDAELVRGCSWGDDGYIVAVLGTESGLLRVPAAGGTPQQLTKPRDYRELTHRWPQLLPGGQSVLFTAHTTQGRFDDANVDVLSLKTSQKKTIHHGGYFGRYLPTGHLVYLRGSTLFAVTFDPVRMETKGTPAPLVEGIQGNVEFGGGQFDFSRNGTLVFLSGQVANEGQPIVWMDAAGKIEPLAPAGYDVSPRLSPDGKRLAVIVRYPKFDLKVYDLQRGMTTQLTFNGGVGDPPSGVPGVPTWAPDGKHIAYGSGNSIRWIRADGAGEPQILLENQIALPYSFSPDGPRLAYQASVPGRPPDLFTLPLDISDPDHPKPGKPEVFLETPAHERFPAFSPDGRWIAYESNESGVFEIFVRRFAGGGASAGKWKISDSSGFPVWSRAGQQLLYKKPSGEIRVVDYTITGDSFQVGKTHQWAGTNAQRLATGGPSFDLSPDGTRLVIHGALARLEEAQGNLHVTMLVNWFDDVRRRMRVGK